MSEQIFDKKLLDILICPLTKEQLIASKYVKEAIKKYKIDTNKPMPSKL